MALATQVTGSGKVIAYDYFREQRQIEIVETDPVTGGLIETGVALREIETFREVREWYALTYAAARGYIDNVAQPEEGRDTYSIALDSPQIPSWTLRRERITEITGPLFSIDPCDDPIFTTIDGPEFTVMITSETPNAKIRYSILSDGSLSGWSLGDSGLTVLVAAEDTLFAFAFRAGRLPSGVVSQIF